MIRALKSKSMTAGPSLLLVYLLFMVTLGFCKEQPVQQFDITSADTKDYIFIENNHLLISYSKCRAAVYNDLRECDYLLGENRVLCRDSSDDLQGYFVKTFQSKAISPALLKNCPMDNKNECRALTKAIIERNPDVCMRDLKDQSQQYSCVALVTLDPKKNIKKELQDTIYYLRAIESLDPQECNSLKDSKLRTFCKAVASGDAKNCEKDKNYEEFIKIYEAEKSKKSQKEERSAQ